MHPLTYFVLKKHPHIFLKPSWVILKGSKVENLCCTWPSLSSPILFYSVSGLALSWICQAYTYVPVFAIPISSETLSLCTSLFNIQVCTELHLLSEAYSDHPISTASYHSILTYAYCSESLHSIAWRLMKAENLACFCASWDSKHLAQV